VSAARAMVTESGTSTDRPGDTQSPNEPWSAATAVAQGALVRRRAPSSVRGGWRERSAVERRCKASALVTPVAGGGQVGLHHGVQAVDDTKFSAGGFLLPAVAGCGREARPREVHMGQRALAVSGVLFRLLRGPGADVELLPHGVRS